MEFCGVGQLVLDSLHCLEVQDRYLTLLQLVCVCRDDCSLMHGVFATSVFWKYIHMLLVVLLQDDRISFLLPQAQKLPALCRQPWLTPLCLLGS